MAKAESKNRVAARSKGWIFEALIKLMDTKPYDKISISDICEKAGIARTTFYHYYAARDDILTEYLHNSIKIAAVETGDGQNVQRHIALTFNYKFITENSILLRKSSQGGAIAGRLTNYVQILSESLIEQFKSGLSKQEYLICRYKLCYQISGAICTFFDWFAHGMPVKVDAFIHILNSMATSEEAAYKNIPGVIVRITEGKQK